MKPWQRPTVAVPLALFAVLMLHGLTIGPTDDEAYYWVLSRTPSLAYAYHPPMVAWVIALFGKLFGAWPLLSVRLPAALLGTGTLHLGLRWVVRAGGGVGRPWATALTAVALPGVFALSWMMVPDLPLFLGWTWAFLTTWEILTESEPRLSPRIQLTLALALTVASKYSGVLAVGSAGLALLFSGRRPMWKALGWVVLGAVLGALPALLWNAQHEWASILYQIRDRHSGGGVWSAARYLRFWGIEAIAVGPLLLGFAFYALGRGARDWKNSSSVWRYSALWMAPSLVFLIQPAFSEFKPHWAFIFFWPAVLVMAWEVDRARFAPWFGLQRGWAMMLAIVVVVVCQTPIITALTGKPLMDVSNDLYGWRELPDRIQAAGLGGLPVVGSWYQTASQASFALAGTSTSVTMVPRDLKARDEWPDVPGLVDHTGPAWPRLLKPTLYVTDERYSAVPEFPGARCDRVLEFQELRSGLATKKIAVWKCAPGV